MDLENDLYSIQTKQNELNQQAVVTEADEKGLETAINKDVKGLNVLLSIETDTQSNLVKLNDRL